jgi:hypothetical protein
MADRTATAARLAWYGRRLRSMGPKEFVWRVGQAIPTGLHSEPDHESGVDWVCALEAFRTGADRPILLNRANAHLIAEREPEMVAALVDSASLAAELSFTFFGYPTVLLEKPIDWHYDPIGKFRWPDISSRRLDHRIAHGDVKWIWELNRLQHLPWLAQAWLFTGDRRFSRAAFEQLDTWIEQNPRGRGIAWRGALEAGIRAVSVAVAIQGLRDSPDLTVERYRRIVAMLGHSAFRCWRERSRFSSANAHLMGEMAGLAVVALLFPDLRLAREWERRAVDVLSAEAANQILPDGCGAEQSVGYQMGTVELLQLVAVMLAKRDRQAPAAITDAIARSTEFLTAVVGAHDPDPRWGDSDQEFAIRLGPEQARTVREHLGIVATSEWGAAGAQAGTNTLTAEWYRSPTQSSFSSASSRELRPAFKPRSMYAPDGGVVILRGQGRRLIMDVGALGYLSIAAHGHADALAVTVSQDNEYVIGDPGTGSYYRQPEFRALMRGTRAHATVCIDGQDQSVIGGPFLWSRHARTTVRRVDLLAGVVDAEHDGYLRLPGRPIHRRWLIAPADDRAHLVVDQVNGSGHHRVRTTWPLHPSVEPTHIPGGYLLTRQGKATMQLLQCATSTFKHEDMYGDEDGNVGWWSDRLEQRVPTWWLSGVCDGALPVVVATLMTPIDGVVTSELKIGFRDCSIDVTWRENDAVRALKIDTTGSGAVSHRIRSE